MWQLNPAFLSNVAAMGAAPSGPASAIVSGAGTAAANGTYALFGENDGRPRYSKDGTSGNVIYWDEDEVGWVIEVSFTPVYIAFEDVAFPWLAVTWTEITGSPPPPSVTEG